MTDTVIFDLGKVLADYDWESYLKQFSFDEKTYRIVADAVFLNEAWVLGDRGVVTPEEWLQCFIQNAPDYEAEIRRVFEGLGGCIHKFSYTDRLIAHFREKGYRIYYLSNYSEGLYEATKEELGFINDFDGGVFSYKEKCIKPEEKIYKILLTRYNIKPENAVFFDDRPENVEAAKLLGIQGVLFSPEVVREYLG
ncbi:MAG: HAD family phosphatase [Lachnospiraceae bacterium]|nr:HAD family phosphatase [Lachnospiraceae bacterium]